MKHSALAAVLPAVLALWFVSVPAAAQRPPAPGIASQNPPSPAMLHADTIDAAARTLPRLYSLLVSRRGEVIFERYYNGRGRDRMANIKSASKSVISALVGIALDRKLIPGLKTPISTYFPELAQDPDVRKRAITVEHLLTMRPGLEGTSNRNYGAWVTSRNWVRHALARPMFAAPGEEMEYSTGNTHLLSAILTQATAKSTWQFANETLAKALGFTLAQWPRDPQGIYFGGNDMLMTPRQMVAFGELYLKKGAVGGQQIVPASWVEESFVPRTRSRWSDQTYGYGWWARELAGQDVRFAWGFGGQYIFIVPALDLVVVATSSSTVDESRRSHRRTVMDIVEQLIVERIANDDSL